MKESGKGFAATVGFCLLALMPGCAATPPPKIIHEDRALSVRLITDRRSEVPHSHPSHLAAGQTAGILGGLRVLKSGSSSLEIQEGASSDASGPADYLEGTPVFSRDEVRMLAPYLAQALTQALPSQLITFYVRSGQPGDPSARRVVTSGALFVQEDRLFIILANYRTTPFGNAFEGSTISELDIRSDPLVPIVRAGYALGFSPATALARTGGTGHGWSYVEEQKMAVIDLTKVSGKVAE